MHWTQTPEGRERMSKIQLRSAKQRSKNKKAEKKRDSETHNTGRISRKETFNRLARVGALAERDRLRKELETIEIFINGTK